MMTYLRSKPVEILTTERSSKIEFDARDSIRRRAGLQFDCRRMESLASNSILLDRSVVNISTGFDRRYVIIHQESVWLSG